MFQGTYICAVIWRNHLSIYSASEIGASDAIKLVKTFHVHVLNTDTNALHSTVQWEVVEYYWSFPSCHNTKETKRDK